MSKLVPSPDWFVGVDSLDLCEAGHLAASVSRDLAPQDGGTDNGFTFTSPNWPTQPRGVIFSISSRYPTHPAGSFHYPHLENLPVIATIRFDKVSNSLPHASNKCPFPAFSRTKSEIDAK